MDDSRSGEGQAESDDVSELAQPVEAEQPVSEPEPQHDDYVPV